MRERPIESLSCGAMSFKKEDRIPGEKETDGKDKMQAKGRESAFVNTCMFHDETVFTPFLPYLIKNQ